MHGTSACEKDNEKLWAISRITWETMTDQQAGSNKTDVKQLRNFWEKEYGEPYLNEFTNYRGAPKNDRVYNDARTQVLENDEDFRSKFINEVVCERC